MDFRKRDKKRFQLRRKINVSRKEENKNDI